MKRRTLKKQIPELANRLSLTTRKYLAANARVHQDVIYGYQRDIESCIVALMRIYLTLDRTWPHRERWLDGLSEEFLWERKRGILYGHGELCWGHWPETGREITGLRFTTALRLCPRHRVEYRFEYGDVNDARSYSSRGCRKIGSCRAQPPISHWSDWESLRLRSFQRLAQSHIPSAP